MYNHGDVYVPLGQFPNQLEYLFLWCIGTIFFSHKSQEEM